MRTTAIANNVITVLMKLVVLIGVISFNGFPLWIAILVEMLVSATVMYNSTHILE